MQVRLASPLENKEQLIRFRVYGKSATSAQTEEDGYRRTDRYILIFAMDGISHVPCEVMNNNELFQVQKINPNNP